MDVRRGLHGGRRSSERVRARALVTLVIYGVLPLALFLWLFGTPQRRRDRTGRARVARGESFGPRTTDQDATRRDDSQ